MRAPLALIAAAATLAACNARSPAPPRNTAPGTATLEVDRSQPLGWLALATAPTQDDEAAPYAPVSATYPLVATAEAAQLPATANVVGTRGGVQAFQRGAPTNLPYGCDQNQLAVTPFTGPRLPPGPAWILPPSAPPTWQVAPLALTSHEASAAHHRYTIGSLTLDLARTADTRGTLTLTRDGRTVHREDFERVTMEGADESPIDLAAGGPAIPEPAAAWSLADDAAGGPVLLVLSVPGYEGSSLRALLVQATATRVLEDMSVYLYACAF